MAVETFTLEQVPAAFRPELLRSALSDLPMPVDLRLEHANDLSARFGKARLGEVDVELFEIMGAHGRAERHISTANSRIAPLLTVHLLSAGSVDLLQNGRAATPRVGDVVLSSTEYSFTTVQRGVCHQRTFTVAYDDLGVDARLIRSALATSIGPGHPLAGVLAAHLSHVAALVFGPSGGHSPVNSAGPMGRSVIELIRAFLLAGYWDETAAREPLQVTLADRIVQYVRTHASDPELSAAQIASAHGISVRYLYVVLARQGLSLGDWLKQVRLERAARMLGEPSSSKSAATKTVSAIAHECGFADHAHFARSFRSAYGMTPTEWRRRGLL